MLIQSSWSGVIWLDGSTEARVFDFRNDVPCIEKPYRSSNLVKALRRLESVDFERALFLLLKIHIFLLKIHVISHGGFQK